MGAASGATEAQPPKPDGRDGPEPTISALQALMVAFGVLVIGGGFVFLVAATGGPSPSAMIWPAVVGTTVGLAGGVAAYKWSANRYRQGRFRASRSITLGSVLAIAGVAATVRQGPTALQVGLLAACVVWLATIMSLAAVWIAKRKSSKQEG